MARCERDVYIFQLKKDKGRTYIRLFLNAEQREKNRIRKALEVDLRKVLLDMPEGEAWVQIRGSQVERVIHLSSPQLDRRGAEITDTIPLTIPSNRALPERLERRNISCGICQQKTAEIVCCCKFPLTFLCEECQNKHIQKARSAFHLEQPIEKSEMIRSWDDVQRARRVLENHELIEQFLDLNKTEVARLKDEVNAVAEKLITQINAAKEATMKELNKIENIIEEKRRNTKEEVQTHLFEVEPFCSDALSRAAFDTSKQFACEELLQAELCRDALISSRLAQLQIPQFFRGYVGPLSQLLREPESEFPGESANVQREENLWEILIPQEVQYQGPPSQVAGANLLDITDGIRNFVHAAPYREDFDVTIPSAIARHRLPIESLHTTRDTIGEWIYEKDQLIKEKYFNWRRSIADGNSFYRCAGVLLCEHFCRPSTPLEEFYQFTIAVMRQIPYNSLMADSMYSEGIALWGTMLKDLYEARQKGENAFQKLQYYLQIPQVDKAIVLVMRSYTASYLHVNAETSELRQYLPDGPDSVLNAIISFGIEAEGVSLMLTAHVLNVIIHIATTDQSSPTITETVFGPSQSGWYPALHLLHLPGHYDILIPNQWEVADRYDLRSNTYSPVVSGTVVDYEKYQSRS